MRITYGLQTKRGRRVERALNAMVRMEAQEDELDHEMLTLLVNAHRDAERIVSRFESRDIERSIEEEVV